MKVSLFVTCLVDQLFPEVGLSAVRVLERAGCQVHFDRRQSCCGQPAFNSGYPRQARRVAEHFLDVFGQAPCIVTPSGSCAAMIKHHLPGLFAPHSDERRRAQSIASKTWEFSQFLVDKLGVSHLDTEFPHPVTYHDSCHLLRELGVSEAPRRLIRSLKGIDFREMKDSQRCCGFGGTFSVKFQDVSAAVGLDKIEAIRETGAAYVVACDISCLMHLQGLLRRRKVNVRILHLAQLLDDRRRTP
ncbi:MAG TPA: (Fe-S)-binding protein [Acidobacteriota bacterium]|nr:(Fe-S)-binding protein [Acidobacteriota bacterium]